MQRASDSIELVGLLLQLLIDKVIGLVGETWLIDVGSASRCQSNPLLGRWIYPCPSLVYIS